MSDIDYPVHWHCRECGILIRNSEIMPLCNVCRKTSSELEVLEKKPE